MNKQPQLLEKLVRIISLLFVTVTLIAIFVYLYFL